MNSHAMVEFESGDSGSLATVKEENLATNEAIYELGRTLREYVALRPGITLRLDFSRVRFFSSAVLSDLLQIQDALGSTKGSLRLRGVHGSVGEIIKLTGMDRVFMIDPEHDSWNSGRAIRRSNLGPCPVSMRGDAVGESMAGRCAPQV